MSVKSNWNDLGPRVMSAVVMLLVGGTAIWLGGLPFHLLVSVVTGLMVWELVRILGPKEQGAPMWLGLLAAAVMFATVFLPPFARLPVLLAPVLAGMSSISTGTKGSRVIWCAYGAVIVLACYSALSLRGGHGLFWLAWLAAVVIMSDVAGYFAGRSLGGPKFWPQVSPKKTWSGTIAGWIGAALVGGWFMLNSPAGPSLIALSVLTAFAAQMGDIAESAIKRRYGIKDSSNLIPGHGGFLDRFDGFLGALLLVLIAGQVLGFLPEVR